MENGGPFRVPRPADRKVVSRAEPSRPQPETVQPTKEEPRAANRAATSHHASKNKKPVKRFILPLVIIVVLCIAGLFAWSKMQNTSTAIDAGRYQAVFFTNGQVYFGKLKSVNHEYLQLTEVFYLQSQQSTDETDSKNPQETSTDQSGVQLIKLGDEIHGPEDKMVISKDQVLFYENLKSDGKVAQSIDKFKASK